MLNVPNNREEAMAQLTSAQALEALGGNPETIGRDLDSYSEAARILSSCQPRLIDQHVNEWVAIFDGQVAASAADYPTLLAMLTTNHIPAENTLVRYIDKEEKTLIL